ncbi:hypothetical protein B0T17DRAFT_483079 [Bombardia bombarda]|uniref:Uncharacterized protein n=1 Tax=Bombardia bombarda TaxID=252184 RepID=A0AA40CDQ4_9PEZI|nr:hypothetical protein B0T17DRAFT_483079 [Bombardia bombarda]
MAVRYGALGRASDDTQDESLSPFLPGGSASPLSPVSRSTTTTTAAMVSPSSSTYLTLADQTFTPLSMYGSEYYITRTATATGTSTAGGTGTVITGGSGGTGSAGSASSSTVPAITRAAAHSGATIVGAMVQSFEALQATTTGNGYDLIPTKSNATETGIEHRDLGLLSPPSTLSPSPSLSLSSPLTSPSPSRLSRRAVQGGIPVTTQSPVVVGYEKSRIPPANRAAAALTHPDQQGRTVPPATPENIFPDVVNAANLPTSSNQFHLAPSTPIARPTPSKRRPHTLQLAPTSPTQFPIVRTSSTASLNLSHPTPDLNKRSRSGAYLGNIAALEATAERLSMTSSIEDAIRDEHNELKRSDSRRSSILRVNSGSKASDTRSSIASRQSSILSTNNAARLGGYSPGGYIMSPQHSLSGASARLRSASRDESVGVVSPISGTVENDDFSTSAGNGEDFPFMARNGPGKSSMRSIASKLSLAQISELDPPVGLTQAAFDEADRAAAAREDFDDDDEDRIRAMAHQHIEEQFADGLEDMSTPRNENSQPILDQGEYFNAPAPRMQLQLHQPSDHPHYAEQQAHENVRPTTSGSVGTFEQAIDAFGDFDGVHCDPEVDESPAAPKPAVPRHLQRPHDPAPPRPKSYFDPSTGQQMLFYPAPVPAMLNLPPKLSKKPKAAAAVRNMRRSQVLGAMPQAARDSRVWLPDPMEGLRESRDDQPFMTITLDEDLGSGPLNPDSTPHLAEQPPAPPLAGTADVAAAIALPQQEREIRRPKRLTDADKRKSRATMLEGVPPQLRASAFFDLPSTTPKIEVKGGSAIATLDSILDASASAPVSAFLDHAFAGKLGSEVYGREKKKSRKSMLPAASPDGKDANARNTIIMKNSSTGDLLAPPTAAKRRTSNFSLMGGKKNKYEDDDEDEVRTTIGLVSGEDGVGRVPSSRRDDRSPRTEQGPSPPDDLASGSEEDESEEDEEEAEGFHGPPTTLLAELQLRKQQNKLRTRPTAQAYPNGMHSTLLELDTVAQLEREARKGRKVNLAWEDPNANVDTMHDSDDDNVPLAMLYVAKATKTANGSASRSTADLTAILNEVNRPLGLMERRELEDNEPLSRRRDRIQGKDSSLLAPVSLGMMQKRMSQLTLSPMGGPLGGRSQSRLNLAPMQPTSASMAGSIAGDPVESVEPEFEGESLAARKARLAAENPLPRARPVSGSFSAELLSHFGGDGDEDRPNSKDSDAKSKGKGRFRADSYMATPGGLGKENTPPSTDVPEEEETLGQRRRRLQAEREAREREMGKGPIIRSGTPLGLNANAARSNASLAPPANIGQDSQQRLSRKLSMADILGHHPLDTRVDVRKADRIRREADATRIQRENAAKMAAMRAQMPTMMSTVSVGAPNGGFMGGRFNNGLGGSSIPSSGGGVGGLGIAGNGVYQQQQQQQTVRAVSGSYNVSSPYGNSPYGNSQIGSTMLPNMNMNPAYGSAYGMPVVTPQAHAEMVERWRQSIMP